MTLKDYLQTQIDLIPEESDITSPTVNNDPKIIFVNGHFTSIKLLGPTEGGRNYWFDGNNFFNAAASSFGLTAFENKFADGKKWLLSFASTRQAAGRQWAEDNYNDLVSNSTNILDFYFVSHSQGGAFSVGIAEYLKVQGHNIKQLLFLSCHQGDNIDTTNLTSDSSIKMYQMLYGKFIANMASIFICDAIVGDYRVVGAKYGIIIRDDLAVLDFHGVSNSQFVFPRISDLRNVTLINVWGADGHLYKGQANVSNNTLFYSINGIPIHTNFPGFQ